MKQTSFYHRLAEMGAAFLCGHCGIENRTIEESAAYIRGWLDKLRDDCKLIVHAAAQAQKACDFIITAGGNDLIDPNCGTLARRRLMIHEKIKKLKSYPDYDEACKNLYGV